MALQLRLRVLRGRRGSGCATRTSRETMYKRERVAEAGRTTTNSSSVIGARPCPCAEVKSGLSDPPRVNPYSGPIDPPRAKLCPCPDSGLIDPPRAYAASGLSERRPCPCSRSCGCVRAMIPTETAVSTVARLQTVAAATRASDGADRGRRGRRPVRKRSSTTRSTTRPRCRRIGEGV